MNPAPTAGPHNQIDIGSQIKCGNQDENDEQGRMDSSGEPRKRTIRRDLEYPYSLVIDPKLQEVADQCHGVIPLRCGKK